MNKRGLINWAIWISVAAGIYCAIYALTIGAWTSKSFLPGWHIVYVTFTALPIYFTAGAKRSEFINYCCSYVVGVLWGMLYLVVMDRLAFIGWPWWLNVGVVVAALCTVECAIHFCLPAKLPFNVVPAQFGAISMTFWTSNLTLAVIGPGSTAKAAFYNFKVLPITMITLCTGTLLGLICNEGLHFIDPVTGKWKLPTKSNKQPD
jgi:hypothetical protein